MSFELELWLGLILLGAIAGALVVGLAYLALSSPLLLRWTHLLLLRLPQWAVKYIGKQVRLSVQSVTAEQWLLLRLLAVVGVCVGCTLPIPTYVKVGLVLLCVFAQIYQLQQRREYLQQVIEHWPSALEITSMLLHSGLSLSASLHALHDIPGSSASLKELARINRQQQAGMGLTDALDELYERVPHRLVELFANAIKQAKITGSSLADTLQKQAQQCREQELLAAEKRAQEVSVKLLFPLLTCFFPVTFLLILGPVFIGFSLE
ncbi:MULTISPECIES: type II secretion system F family protein [Idiomarinaceae]|uniref:Flp pilus assembly protein TadB n=3 Tax=Pseudidiomarina TaxID=2800384 RepID=A0A368UM02_9GAMM|nr:MULTISPECIES: type II secretion system F family protein [Idiomarinaceae]NCU57849.1 hypothetical protein [Idiomarina sp. FenA--70]NCU60401.1 hypothetical protein [Idiomarina sp. FenBw--71]MDT7526652.1 type II secretion system F family protein [Pseudidiomarina sp. GXY010]MDX1526657.1 type II secretion system F family protein [Pseudidiomarina maritima]MRJ41860.1 hypothetical protein [Idiomarina sp. FeN1]